MTARPLMVQAHRYQAHDFTCPYEQDWSLNGTKQIFRFSKFLGSPLHKNAGVVMQRIHLLAARDHVEAQDRIHRTVGRHSISDHPGRRAASNCLNLAP